MKKDPKAFLGESNFSKSSRRAFKNKDSKQTWNEFRVDDDNL